MILNRLLLIPMLSISLLSFGSSDGADTIRNVLKDVKKGHSKPYISSIVFEYVLVKNGDRYKLGRFDVDSNHCSKKPPNKNPSIVLQLGSAVTFYVEGIDSELSRKMKMFENIPLSDTSSIFPELYLTRDKVSIFSGSYKISEERSDLAIVRFAKLDGLTDTILSRPVLERPLSQLTGAFMPNLSLVNRQKIDFKDSQLKSYSVLNVLAPIVPNTNWRLTLIVVVVIGLIAAGFLTKLLRDGWVTLAGEKQLSQFSMSRFLSWFWLSLVLTLVLYIYLSTGVVVELNGKVLILLGITITTTTAGLFVNGNNPLPRIPKPSTNFLYDVMSDDNGLSIQRFQVFIWNLFFGLYFVLSSLKYLSMPVFDDTWLLLMGISNGAYLALKPTENKQSEIAHPPTSPAASGQNPDRPMPS